MECGMKWTVLRCSSHSWEQPLRLKASSASHAQTNLQKRANGSLSLLRFLTFTYDILSEPTLPPQHFETVVKKNKKNVTWRMTNTRSLSHAISAVRRKRCIMFRHSRRGCGCVCAWTGWGWGIETCNYVPGKSAQMSMPLKYCSSSKWSLVKLFARIMVH